MSIILDVILIAIIGIAAGVSAHKGFVRTAIELAGFIAAIVIAFAVSTPLAELTYDAVLEKPMMSAASSSIEELPDKLWEAMPEVITKNASTIGFEKEDIEKLVMESSSETSEAAAKKVSEKIIKPAAVSLIKSFFVSIIFIVLMIVVHFIAKLLNGLFSFSIIGKLNTGLGAMVGIVKGLIYCFAFVCVVVLIASLNRGSFLIFSDKSIGESFLFRFLAELSSLYPFK